MLTRGKCKQQKKKPKNKSDRNKWVLKKWKKKQKITREELGNEEKKTKWDQTRRCKQDEIKTRNPFLWTSQNLFKFDLIYFVSEKCFSTFLQIFFVQFSFFCSASFSCVFLSFFSKNRKKRDTAWCDGCPTDETNDNWTYMDFTRSTTSPHAAVIKRAFNRASTLRPMRKKWFSLETKKGDLFFQNPQASMAFAESETKVTKTLLPFVDHNVDVSWQRGDTLLQQHRRHNTGELPNAHHNGIEHCHEACKNDGISYCQRRHCGVHDGVGHASLHSLVWEHDGRHCQCPEVIQSLLLPFRVKWCFGSTRKNSWSGPLQPRKTRYDGTRRQDVLTENKHPPPRRTLLFQTEELPSLLGHCGGRKTTF